MNKWKMKLRYLFLGVDYKGKIKQWALRLLKSKMLYFYVLILSFLWVRGFGVLQKFNNNLVLNTYELREFSNKYNTETPCNTKQNTIEYNGHGSQNGEVVFQNQPLHEDFPSSVGSKMTDDRPDDSDFLNESCDLMTTRSGVDDRIAFGSADGRGYSLEEFNALSERELLLFHGVGPVTAERIVRLRDARGGFRSFDEIMDVKGIGPAKFRKIMGEEDEVNGANK